MRPNIKSDATPTRSLGLIFIWIKKEITHLHIGDIFAVILCNSPSSPQHCTVTCTKSNYIGSVCTYQCAPGLTLSGSSQRVCQEVSGNAAHWTGTQPTCTGRNTSHMNYWKVFTEEEKKLFVVLTGLNKIIMKSPFFKDDFGLVDWRSVQRSTLILTYFERNINVPVKKKPRIIHVLS